MATRTRRLGNKLASSGEAAWSELLDSANELLDSIRDESGPAAERLRSKLGDTIDAASEHLESLRDDASDVGQQALESTLRFVRRDPWRAIALGALIAVGVMIAANLASDD
jgi:ElaB/YqjD/DUF883 family membrane-anchored ribosome-binding protein